MKLILDCNAADMGNALQLFFRVNSQNPTQETGRGAAIREMIGGKTFEVIRNADSFTVRQGK